MHPTTRSARRSPFGSALLVAAALLAAAPLAAGDGDLDPGWGTGGISLAYADAVAFAGAVSGDQTMVGSGVSFTPADNKLDWFWTEEEGDGWVHCLSGFLFVDNLDMRDILFDGSGRPLFVGQATVTGTESVKRAFIARFTGFPGCTLDSTFAGSGWQILDDAPQCDTEDCRLIDIEESADATTRYVALLESVQNALISEYFLVGLTGSGNLDPNFGSGGYAPVTAANLGVLASDGAELVIDAANRTYVLHSFFDPDASFDLDTGLTRFQSDGDLDPTFASSGTRFLHSVDNQDTLPRALAIGNDGRLALAHYNVTIEEATLFALRPSTGQALSTTQSPREPKALAFDGLGRLLYAYDFPAQDGLGVARYLTNFGTGFPGDSTFDSLFLDIDEGSTHGEIPVDIDTVAGRPTILIDSDQDGGGRQAFLVRLQNDLIFADGFEWGSTKFW